MQNIYNKLAKNKKVKLSAIDNISNRMSFFEECKQAAEYFAYTSIPDKDYEIEEQLNEWASYFDNEYAGSVATLLGQQIEEIESELNPLMENLDYLGVDYSEIDINGLSLPELIAELDNAKFIYDDFKEAYKEAVTQYPFLDDMSGSFS